jgi:YHS domain-containing protein
MTHNAECEWCHKPIHIVHANEGMTYAFCSSECEEEYEKEQRNLENQMMLNSEEFQKGQSENG